MKKPKSLSREALYQEVWETPGTKLAERYGISDVALAKICRKMEVPHPYRGYWRRVQSGQSPKRTPLPPAKSTTMLSYELSRRPASPTSGRSRPIRKKRVEFRHPIVVPDRLARPHPVVEGWKVELERRAKYAYGASSRFDHRSGGASVHPKVLSRGFRVMDAFIKAVEERGYVVTSSERWLGGATAHIFGHEIHFDLKERESAREGDTAPEAASFGWSWEDHPVRNRRGLVFRVYSGWSVSYGASHWRDGKRQRLEDLLDRILLQMVRRARHERHQEIKREKWRREWEEKERLRKQREAEIAAEKQRREALMRAAASWKESRLLREFLAAMKKEVRLQSQEFSDLLCWGSQVADELDPLSELGEEKLRGLLKGGEGSPKL